MSGVGSLSSTQSSRLPSCNATVNSVDFRCNYPADWFGGTDPRSGRGGGAVTGSLCSPGVMNVTRPQHWREALVPEQTGPAMQRKGRGEIRAGRAVRQQDTVELTNDIRGGEV